MYMLPSDMNLKIKARAAGYNNEILVADTGFSLGRNDAINVSTPHVSPQKVMHNPPHEVHQALPYTEQKELPPYTSRKEENCPNTRSG